MVRPLGSRAMSDDLFLVSPRRQLAAGSRQAREEPVSSHADIRPSSFPALLSGVGVIANFTDFLPPHSPHAIVVLCDRTLRDSLDRG